MSVTVDRRDIRDTLFEVLHKEGSITQGEIVDRVPVSKATVSRVLAQLEQEDRIVRLPIRGRNVIWHPDSVPEVIE